MHRALGHPPEAPKELGQFAQQLHACQWKAAAIWFSVHPGGQIDYLAEC